MTDGVGILQLHDCVLKEAECKARIAGMMAETALKWQEVRHKSLQNLALWLDIKWDAQAHDNLIRQKMKAQNLVTKLKEQSEHITRKLEWALKMTRASGLSYDGVRAAWLGFYFITDKTPPKILIAAYAKLEPDPEAFKVNSWAHPYHRDGSIVTPYQGVKDPTSLFAWAARHNYFPVYGEHAYEYYVGLLEHLNEGALQNAVVLEKKIADAEAHAMELSKIDWGRLDKDKPDAV